MQGPGTHSGFIQLDHGGNVAKTMNREYGEYGEYGEYCRLIYAKVDAAYSRFGR